jgi:uncharacterized protein YkwD
MPILGGMAAARRIVALLAIALAASPAALAAPSRPAVGMSTLERSVLVDINTLRAQHHLAKLRFSARLTTAARAHTQQMANDGYFAHESADGSAFWKRVQRFYASSPWRFWSVGENLLWSSRDIDSRDALRLWWGSPEHRKNLLNPAWREIGVSALHAAQAPGVYGGLDVTIVTTDFGVRR